MVVNMDELFDSSEDEKFHLKHPEIILSSLRDNKLYVVPKRL